MNVILNHQTDYESMKFFLKLSLLFLFFSSCKKEHYTAQEIVDLAIQKSGVHKLENSILHFDFREIHYTAHREQGTFKLTRKFTKDSLEIEDILSNDGFMRKVNDQIVTVPDSMSIKYSESVNSVHYFSKLPLGLNDRAVIKKLLPTVKIKGKEYYKIQIAFQKQGGGVDYNDVFMYWFEKDTFHLDYVAYSFQVNGGGVRFRSVSKAQNIEGIRFLDYVNYKPSHKEIELASLDKLYENNKLVKASEIQLKNVKVMANQHSKE